ncbi:aryl-alcohol dehydrogenase-like predicted oxidoreductase [Paenibacillus cellulosilyticus]|uniref:Aryl-alcohol dehydrogenase-like predicted oxidoreductase n=1 Tax=Paenibacillus cellulosilyticus TaxID=375489 RepID=A0A2V2YRG1_9BACL|nr:aldo/keto reductase [Paenibacillus cellulosilyticus]PWV99726.1 aryl-alcohol dehydrogenase-like predicted oxidoreductase [Paenibacillus cellulosilyticus]QKS44844.1 aldo/keto reductase [Paenibacillus cellulosilyticus]
MELRHLGATDLRLTPIGLGTWQFSGGRGGIVGKYWPTLPEEQVREIIRICLEGGINWFDTAEVYGNGESERVLAASLQALAPLSNESRIATKWWPIMRTAANIPQSIGERKKALADRTIDLYQVHQPFSFSSATSEMKQMAKLAEQGHIRHIGVSNFSAKKMREADRTLRDYGLRLASNQVKYSLLDRQIEHNGILETAKELGVAIIAYSPLKQGLLSGKFHRNPELLQGISAARRINGGVKRETVERSRPLMTRMEQLAEQYGVSPTQIALNWLIHANGETVFAIPGASKPHHAEELAGAMRFKLTSEELSELGSFKV